MPHVKYILIEKKVLPYTRPSLIITIALRGWKESFKEDKAQGK